MELMLYQVDAFTSKPFAGNPAAVCPVDEWPSDHLLQAVAAENNLSETAFIGPGENGLAIRWFTPAAEVDLCGHATLAAARVLFSRDAVDGDRVEFESRSGMLAVDRLSDGRLEMNLPAWHGEQLTVTPGIAQTLGTVPQELWRRVSACPRTQSRAPRIARSRRIGAGASARPRCARARCRSAAANYGAPSTATASASPGTQSRSCRA